MRKFIIIFICFYLTGCAALVSRDNQRDFELGKEALKQESYEEAINYFTEYLKNSPGDVDAHLQLGMSFLKKERLKEAVNEFKQVVKLDPENEKAKSLIKKSIFDEFLRFSQEGKEETSMRYLTAYLTINPDDVDTYLALSKVFIKRGDTRNALWCINKLVSLDPRNPEVIELLDYVSGGFH